MTGATGYSGATGQTAATGLLQMAGKLVAHDVTFQLWPFVAVGLIILGGITAWALASRYKG